MITNFWHAYRGKIEWGRLKRKYKINIDSVVIVLPETDSEWNRYALMYLNNYMKRKSAKYAYVLVADEVEYKKALDFEKEDVRVLKYAKHKMDNLLKYYCLDYFYDNICFFYLKEGTDNCSYQLLNTGEIDKEELIYFSFYGLRVVDNKETEERLCKKGNIDI